MSKKIYYAVLEEIYNNVVPHWSAFLISCTHSITRLISFTKNASNQISILSVYGPWNVHLFLWISILVFILSVQQVLLVYAI
jgi:hypothetical protein